jgi:D-aminoacyl-tRNA deacylase
MRAVVQRVSEAKVEIDENTHSEIKKGLLILLGIESRDTEEDVKYLAGKILRLRIFSDENSLMNLSCTEVNGEFLVISQFTLFADTRKGNRPSFIRAARPEQAKPLYQDFITLLEMETGKAVKCGIFAADMKIHLINDGPVTILLDSHNRDL